VDEDGMIILRARRTPELGAVVRRALDAAAERLYQQGKHAAAPHSIEEEVSFAQRRADALALIAECALQSDLDRGRAADRYQVVLHIEPHADAHEPVQTMVEIDQGAIRVPRKRPGASHVTPASS
jgi:hypothetical protein